MTEFENGMEIGWEKLFSDSPYSAVGRTHELQTYASGYLQGKVQRIYSIAMLTNQPISVLLEREIENEGQFLSEMKNFVKAMLQTNNMLSLTYPKLVCEKSRFSEYSILVVRRGYGAAVSIPFLPLIIKTNGPLHMTLR